MTGWGWGGRKDLVLESKQQESSVCTASDSTTEEPAVWPSFRMKPQGEGMCERPKRPR